MATHLIAFQGSVDAATLTALPTVVDDVLTRTGTTRYVVPEEYNYVRFAIATGPNLTRAVLVAPSLEVRRMRGEIIPHTRGTETLNSAKPAIALFPTPLALTPSEELEAQVTEDAAGASQVNVLVSLSPAELPPPPGGDLRIVRATSSTTLTPRTWTTVNVTLDLSLEPGEYALVGFLPISANCIAARALITGQVFRPGMPGLAGSEPTARDFDYVSYERLMFYDMGHFTHINVPQFQFFSAAADTSEVVIMYLVKVGG